MSRWIKSEPPAIGQWPVHKDVLVSDERTVGDSARREQERALQNTVLDGDVADERSRFIDELAAKRKKAADG